jgi:hypothetical protein
MLVWCKRWERREEIAVANQEKSLPHLAEKASKSLRLTPRLRKDTVAGAFLTRPIT